MEKLQHCNMYDFLSRKIRDLKALTLIKECKQAHMNIMLPQSQAKAGWIIAGNNCT